MTAVQTTKLKDRRNLTWQVFGDPDGISVFYFHGWPSCRLEATLLHPAAVKQGIRLIAIDRPGMGQSSFKANRCLLDWPDDVAELADQLGLDKFSIVGLSGGGPYIAACAAKIPERLEGISIIAGVTSMLNPRTQERMRSANKFLLSAGRVLPLSVTPLMWLTRRMLCNAKSLAGSIGDLPEADQQVISDLGFENMADINREAFSQGLAGAGTEVSLYANAWGFELADITVPLSIWQGDLDVNVPQSNGEIYQDEIKNATLRRVPGEGHLSIVTRQGEAILSDLMAMRQPA